VPHGSASNREVMTNQQNHDIRWKQRFDNFQRALHQLTLAIQLNEQRPLSDLEQQGLIQGFEFTHELAWNVLKDYLEMEGIQGLVGSRSTVREAFKRGLVRDGEAWMDMIEKRNLSSHTYNQSVAITLASAIVDRYYTAFLELQQRFASELRA
jgi:nucleotidyltransferase substrate binding protein (TIGR01987 family)